MEDELFFSMIGSSRPSYPHLNTNTKQAKDVRVVELLFLDSQPLNPTPTKRKAFD